VGAGAGTVDDPCSLETLIPCRSSNRDACTRSIQINSLQPAFPDAQRAGLQLGIDDVGDRGRHTVPHHIPPPLQMATEAALLLNRKSKPEVVGCLSQAVDRCAPLCAIAERLVEGAQISQACSWSTLRNRTPLQGCISSMAPGKDAVT